MNEESRGYEVWQELFESPDGLKEEAPIDGRPQPRKYKGWAELFERFGISHSAPESPAYKMREDFMRRLRERFEGKVFFAGGDIRD